MARPTAKMMRSRNSLRSALPEVRGAERFFAPILRLGAMIFLLFATVAAQKIAVLAPEKNGRSAEFAEALSGALEQQLKLIDPSLAETAFLASGAETPFNLTVEDARNIGAAIGCDYFIIVRAEDLPRYSLAKKEYFESYAAIFSVRARTGGLIDFRLSSFNGFDQKDASRLLREEIPRLGVELAAKLRQNFAMPVSESLGERPAEIPIDGSPDSTGFRPPIPYRRLSPKYPVTADLYAIAATVDIEVDLDEKGTVRRTEIVRWAGFGLDEAVETAVRAMNWRPAERNRRFEPSRFLLRYNFKKIEKED